jgi:hypothetical protein
MRRKQSLSSFDFRLSDFGRDPKKKAAEFSWPIALGALTLGGIVLWALTLGKQGQAPDQAPKPPRPALSETGKKPLDFLGDPMQLRQGETYRFRLRLTDIGLISNKASITNSFTNRGFSNVQVYNSRLSVPSDWPEETITDDGNERFVEATWSAPDTSLDKNQLQIELAWDQGSATS